MKEQSSGIIKRILVIGNMGYVGPVLVKHLWESNANYDIRGYDQGLFAHCLLGVDELPERYLVNQYFGDVRQFNIAVLDEIDAIVYLAAISNDPMGKEFETLTHDINHLCALKIANEAKKKGVQKFIFASSCSVYGAGGESAKVESDTVNPLSAYAKSKVDAETSLSSLANSDFVITCLRFATACGISPRLRLDLILNDFVATAILKKQINILSDGTPLRPLIHVKDMARAIEWSIQRDRNNGGEFVIVNVGSNDWNFSVLELAEEVSKCLGGVKIIVNKEAPPDKRSYRVNFNLYKSLAGEFVLVEKIQNTILDIAKQINQSNFQMEDFYNSDFIRLNVLRKMVRKGLIVQS
jgi:nucleoside-diphosphate-sugar epimerase